MTSWSTRNLQRRANV